MIWCSLRGSVWAHCLKQFTYLTVDVSYRISYRIRPPQRAGSASGVKRTDNVQTLTHLCHEVSVVSI